MKRNKLDEMQEQKLLKTEHTACWLAVFGLGIVLLVEQLMGCELRVMAGELLVQLVLCGYLLCSCVHNGIWDRHLEPNLKTNLLISLGTGAVIGIAWFCISYYRYHSLAGSLATLVFMAGFVGAMCFVLLQVMAAATKKRRNTLDQEDSEEE